MAHDVLRERLRAGGGKRPAGGREGHDAAEDRDRPPADEATHDALIDAVAEEIGGTVEAAMRLVIDRAHDVASSLLGSAGTTGRGLDWLRLSRAADERVSELPRQSAHFAKTSSRWAMRSGMQLLRKTHRTLREQQR